MDKTCYYHNLVLITELLYNEPKAYVL